LKFKASKESFRFLFPIYFALHASLITLFRTSGAMYSGVPQMLFAPCTADQMLSLARPKSPNFTCPSALNTTYHDANADFEYKKKKKKRKNKNTQS
jgi:hypothetical protein